MTLRPAAYWDRCAPPPTGTLRPAAGRDRCATNRDPASGRAGAPCVTLAHRAQPWRTCVTLAHRAPTLAHRAGIWRFVCETVAWVLRTWGTVRLTPAAGPGAVVSERCATNRDPASGWRTVRKPGAPCPTLAHRAGIWRFVCETGVGSSYLGHRPPDPGGGTRRGGQ